MIKMAAMPYMVFFLENSKNQNANDLEAWYEVSETRAHLSLLPFDDLDLLYDNVTLAYF